MARSVHRWCVLASCALALATVVVGASGPRRLQEAVIGGGVDATGQPIGTWRRGRTSWYGTPDWVDPFVAGRGGGKAAFGILEWGGCGYTNGDGTMPVPKEEATAYSDDNEDWGGSCGRCYEVRCVDGPVLGTSNNPIGLEHLFYFPKYANVTDEMGRAFPGNPTESQNYYTVKCWDKNTVVVKVVDLCPCYYCPTGQPCRYQESCCNKRLNHPKSGQHNFDLSFWAFEKLAHPSYGIMMIDFRPVDCATHEPVSYIPGEISRTLYSDMVGTGWAWFAYKTPPEDKNNFQVTAGGQGLGGGNAACAEVEAGGAQSFWSRGAGVKNFEPFSGVNTISFWIRDVNNPGSTPNIRMVVSGDHTLPTNAPPGTLKDEPPTNYCKSEVYLRSRSASQTGEGGWLKFDIPFADFGCDAAVMNKLDFLTQERTRFCMDEVKLL